MPALQPAPPSVPNLNIRGLNAVSPRQLNAAASPRQLSLALQAQAVQAHSPSLAIQAQSVPLLHTARARPTGNIKQWVAQEVRPQSARSERSDYSLAARSEASGASSKLGLIFRGDELGLPQPPRQNITISRPSSAASRRRGADRPALARERRRRRGTARSAA